MTLEGSTVAEHDCDGVDEGSHCDHAAASHGQFSHATSKARRQQPGLCVMHHPYNIRFTQSSISYSFRNGGFLDDAIDKIRRGYLGPTAFPPLEVVVQNKGLFSLSNRRLFVLRALASLGVVSEVQTIELEPQNKRVLQTKWDHHLQRQATNWERSFSTMKHGLSVRVKSKYFGHQFIPESWSLEPGMQSTKTCKVQNRETAEGSSSSELHEI